MVGQQQYATHVSDLCHILVTLYAQKLDPPGLVSTGVGRDGFHHNKDCLTLPSNKRPTASCVTAFTHVPRTSTLMLIVRSDVLKTRETRQERNTSNDLKVSNGRNGVRGGGKPLETVINEAPGAIAGASSSPRWTSGDHGQGVETPQVR